MRDSSQGQHFGASRIGSAQLHTSQNCAQKGGKIDRGRSEEGTAKGGRGERCGGVFCGDGRGFEEPVGEESLAVILKNRLCRHGRDAKDALEGEISGRKKSAMDRAKRKRNWLLEGERYTPGVVGVGIGTGRNCVFGWKGKQIFGCVGQEARKGVLRDGRTKCWTARDLLS